jgi:hypothetical protein
MSKEIISLIIFLCISTILCLNYVYLHKYSELNVPIYILIGSLLFKFYNIYCNINFPNYEILFEIILILIIISILTKYALVKKYISF